MRRRVNAPERLTRITARADTLLPAGRHRAAAKVRTHTPRTDKDPTSTVATFNDYLPIDGPRLSLVVRRDPGDDPDLTFSPEAVDEVAAQMQAWTISRLLRHAHDTGDSPWALRVTVHMDCDVPTTIDDALDDLVIDWRRDWKAQEPTGRLSRYSPAAMDAIRTRMRDWIRTRLLSVATMAGQDGAMPQEMRLTVDVEPRYEEDR